MVVMVTLDYPPPLAAFTMFATLRTVCVKQSSADPTGAKETLSEESELCTISRRDWGEMTERVRGTRERW